jgi:integrase
MDRPTRGYFCRCSRNQISAGIVGLRAGECRGLRWPDVDLDAGRITITGNATRSLDGLQVVTAPKTKAGNRTLILPQLCIEPLRRTPRNGDLIWPGPGGSPWSASSFYTAWQSFCRGNGIRAVTYHALRHTAATLALQAGQPPHVVAFMLGHADVATTLRLYAHVTPVAMEALADSIDAGFGPRLRVIEGSRNGHELANPSESAAIPTEKECRGRESNPYALTSTAP